jgi:uncharacterized HAD superfamily protein/hypoxanthine phosphoribosyltransferase
MHYRSVADMNDTIIRNLHRLPRDIDLVVGIPRSGMLAASMVSLACNLPLSDLDSLVEGRTYTSGTTKRWNARATGSDRPRRVLILDDSINGGSAMRTARERVAAAGLDGEFLFAAVYGSKPEHPSADLWFETVPQPRMFQWNFMHHKFLAQSCVDIDGVLCHDPSNAENDDGDAYVRFLTEARTLYGPTARIGRLVTSRLEKYRPQTEAWLAAQGIEYDELVMLDLPSKAERQRLGVHGGFKAEVYRKSDAILFIESEPDQAERIAALANKPVLCVETQELITPEISAMRAQVAALRRRTHGRKDRLKHAVRRLIGRVAYDRLKRSLKR